MLDPPVELFGIAERRLREHDRELVAPDAARDVGRAHDVAHAGRRVREHAVPGEVPDLVVDRLEVVEVEDDQRQVAVVAVRAGDLARERLVEVAAVVQPGERVEVGQLPGLLEALGVLDRGAGTLRELLELLDRVVAELRLVPGEDGEVPLHVRLGDQGHRNCEPRPDQVAVLRDLAVVVSVADPDRAGPAAVRRPGDRLALGLFLGQPERRDQRRAGGVPDPDEGGVGIRRVGGRLERPGEHLVEVDRAPEVAEDAVPAQLALRLLPGAGELLRQLVDPGVQVVDELGHPGGRALRGAACQNRRGDGRDDHQNCHSTGDQQSHGGTSTPSCREAGVV